MRETGPLEGPPPVGRDLHQQLVRRRPELVRRGSVAEAYMRLAALRYLVLRTHVWDDAVIDRLREELERLGYRGGQIGRAHV